MNRIVKLAAAAIGTAGAVGGAVLIDARSSAGRRLRRQSGEPLAGRVQAALVDVFGDPTDALTIRASRGIVTLRGEVDDIADIADYEAVVRRIAGVQDVDNLLRLRLVGSARPRVLSA